MENKFKSYVLITIGVILLHIGFYFFLVPLNLVTGGVMGLSVLINYVIPLSVGTIYLILNGIALILGAVLFGKEFFIRTVYASLLAPVLVFIFEQLNISNMYLLDKIDPNYQLLVAAISSGVLVGTGIGMVLRFNATTGGMDVVQKIIHQYLKVPFSTAVYVSDGLIILIGMMINFQLGLFAVLSIFVLTYMLEKTVVYGNHAFAIFIISSKPDEIKQAIFNEIDRGLTTLKAFGGYTGSEKEMIITTVNRSQLYDIKHLIDEIDEKAFTLILSTKEVLGQGFKRSDYVWLLKTLNQLKINMK